LFSADRRDQRGLQTLDDARQYLISSKFKRCFNTSGRDFILQFTVKLENKVEVAQAYLKILPANLKQNQFSRQSTFRILFGPDILVYDRKHLDFRVYRNHTVYTTFEPILCFEDRLTHVFTLIIHANQTYKILKDNFTDIESHMEEAFCYASPREIPDPNDRRPADWEMVEYIDDPDDLPPPSMRRGSPFMPDPTAKRPEDWDDAAQGTWTPPLIPDPDYRREWSPRKIRNPAFRGDWVQRNMSNPDHVEDPKFGKPEDLCFVGIDVDQDVAGCIWDNILVTDDFEYSQKMMKETFVAHQDKERAMWKAHEAEEEAKKKKKARDPEFGTGAQDDERGPLPSSL
jgi:calreticulin